MFDMLFKNKRLSVFGGGGVLDACQKVWQKVSNIHLIQWKLCTEVRVTLLELPTEESNNLANLNAGFF